MHDLETFVLPASVTGRPDHRALARRMIAAWQRDGILQVALPEGAARATVAQAFEASRRFVRQPFAAKSRCVSDLSYAGYVASGEEMTAGEADASEIFTVCKDLPLDDARVRAQWPCHGPVPWPDTAYRDRMRDLMALLGDTGERLLRLVALGLGLDSADTLADLTQDGWHHMRVLRFPPASAQGARGIGAHTDYGLLVIAAQDEVGGLWVRPPIAGEARASNWREGESSAGAHEHAPGWRYVTPVPHVLTVFPGDLLQFITGGRLLSTPHKVRLAERERFALAYFHEPNFQGVARPLFDPADPERVHYGSHFTRMFARCYPDRVTTARLVREDRWSVLARLRAQAMAREQARATAAPGASRAAA